MILRYHHNSYSYTASNLLICLAYPLFLKHTPHSHQPAELVWYRSYKNVDEKNANFRVDENVDVE